MNRFASERRLTEIVCSQSHAWLPDMKIYKRSFLWKCAIEYLIRLITSRLKISEHSADLDSRDRKNSRTWSWWILTFNEGTSWNLELIKKMRKFYSRRSVIFFDGVRRGGNRNQMVSVLSVTSSHDSFEKILSFSYRYL